MQALFVFISSLTGFAWSITDSFVLISYVINILAFSLFALFRHRDVQLNLVWKLDIPVLLLILWRFVVNYTLKSLSTNTFTKNLKFIFDISPIFLYRVSLWRDYYDYVIKSFLLTLSLITALSFLELAGFIKLGLFNNGDLLGFHRNHIKSGFIWGLASLVAVILGLKRNKYYLLLSALLVVGLLLTHARSYYLGFMAAVLFISILVSLKHSVRYILYSGSIVVLTFMSILSIDSVRNRFISIFLGISTDGSIMCRLVFMKEALKAFAANPLTGIGYGEWPDYFSKLGYSCPDYHVHNIYLHELVETGIVGFALLSFFVVYTLFLLSKEYLKQDNGDEYILIGISALVLFATGGLFEPNLVKTVVMIPTFTLVGMALSVVKYEQR